MLVTPEAAVGILKPAEVRRDSSASHITTAFADLAPLCRVYNTSFFLQPTEIHADHAVLHRAIHRMYLASLAHAVKPTAHNDYVTAWRDRTISCEPLGRNSRGDLQREGRQDHQTLISSRWRCILFEHDAQSNEFSGQLSLPGLLAGFHAQERSYTTRLCFS